MKKPASNTKVQELDKVLTFLVKRLYNKNILNKDDLDDMIKSVKGGKKQ